MKFIISSSSLLKHLSIINGVIARNPIVPILENFIFQLESNNINIQTTESTLTKVFDNQTINNIYKDSILIKENSKEKMDGYFPIQSLIKNLKIKTDELDDVILRIYKNHENLKYIHHADFEKLVCRLMQIMGFEVQPTKATRDGGYDALLKSKSYFSVNHLLECKSFKNFGKVTISQLRGFMQVINDNNVHGGILVTNTDFTKDVIKAVENIYKRIKLINGNEVLTMINNYCNNFLFKFA